jgi:translation initiation factor IF-1
LNRRPEVDEPGRPLEASGRVVALLPSGLYRIEIDDGRVVVAHAVGSPERNFVRLIVGDRVAVELAPNDRGRGRIVRRM